MVYAYLCRKTSLYCNSRSHGLRRHRHIRKRTLAPLSSSARALTARPHDASSHFLGHRPLCPPGCRLSMARFDHARAHHGRTRARDSAAGAQVARTTARPHQANGRSVHPGLGLQRAKQPCRRSVVRASRRVQPQRRAHPQLGNDERAHHFPERQDVARLCSRHPPGNHLRRRPLSGESLRFGDGRIHPPRAAHRFARSQAPRRGRKHPLLPHRPQSGPTSHGI